MIKYLNTDFYQIKTNEFGERYIHIFGSIYKKDECDEDGNELYSFNEYVFLNAPLKEFVSKEYYDSVELFMEQEFNKKIKIYGDDLDEYEAEEYANDYFNNEEVKELSFSDLSMDVPDGFYVHYEE